MKDIEINRKVTESIPLVFYILLLTNHFTYAIQLELKSVGFKKKADCIVTNKTSNHVISFLAHFPTRVVVLPSVYQPDLSDFENQYILPKLKVDNLSLHIFLEFLPFNLLIECKAVDGIRNVSAYQMLLKHAFPKVVITPSSFKFNTVMVCSSDNFQNYKYIWKCNYNKNMYNLEKLKNSLNIPVELKYFVSSLQVSGNKLTFSPFWLAFDVHCNCTLYTAKDNIELPEVASFVVPKSDLPLFSYIGINCSFPCTYFSKFSYVLTISMTLNYEDIKSYSSFNIYSKAIKLSYSPNQVGRSFSFYPLRHFTVISPSMCISLNWILYWKYTYSIITAGYWPIMIMNYHLKYAVNSSIFTENLAIGSFVEFKCLSNSNVSGAFIAVYVFSLHPLSEINSFYIKDKALKLLPNTHFQQEVHIKCAIFFIVKNLFLWCRFINLGDITRRLIINNYRNITVAKFNVLLPGSYLTIYIEKAFPIEVTIDNFASSVEVMYSSNIEKNFSIPLDLHTFKFINYVVDGFYQFFYSYNIASKKKEEEEILNYVILGYKLSITLNPATIHRGYHIKCITNSIDNLFIFEWICVLGADVILLKLDLNQYDQDLMEKYTNFLNNLLLIDSQTLRFDYILQPDYYDCSCKVSTYPVNGEIFEFSRTFVFRINSDVANILKDAPSALRAYMVLANILWMSFLVLFFSLISINQTLNFKKNRLQTGLSLTLGLSYLNQLPTHLIEIRHYRKYVWIADLLDFRFMLKKIYQEEEKALPFNKGQLKIQSGHSKPREIIGNYKPIYPIHEVMLLRQSKEQFKMYSQLMKNYLLKVDSHSSTELIRRKRFPRKQTSENLDLHKYHPLEGHSKSFMIELSTMVRARIIRKLQMPVRKINTLDSKKSAMHRASRERKSMTQRELLNYFPNRPGAIRQKKYSSDFDLRKYGSF